ncbi:MAG: YezD family protein [Dehalococcoidia bacterium]
MNQPEPTRSRWVRDMLPDSTTPPNQTEWAVLSEVLVALRRVRHGSVEMSVQDGRVVQINTTEKRRL